jgi:predicted nucleotidyltransferase
MVKNISKNLIWDKVFQGLNKAKIKYILVGGAALAVHGIPRSTLDIDIFIPAVEDSLIKLFRVARELGLKSEEEDILRIAHLPHLYANQWICFSQSQQDILDVFLAPEAEFNKLYRNSEVKGEGKVKVRVVSLEDLSRLKKESGRPVDIADLDFIRESKKYRNAAG